jgi:threonine synthase
MTVVSATPAPWSLRCSACDLELPATPRAGLCAVCGQPLLAVHAARPTRDDLDGHWSMWRYRALLPVAPAEQAVSLGEGLTPLVPAPASLTRLAGVRRLWIKDEARNPTASFKARGMSAALTRLAADGVRRVVVPTAGNAGAALAAYGAAAGIAVRVYAPRTTPRPILDTVEAMGAELVRIDGHIGDAGKLALADAHDGEWFNVATLREPYRAEGMKTMGFELAEQLGWRLPDVVVYPTGGGEGTVGIWKAFHEMRACGWLPADQPLPRMVIAQAAGCQPLVRAFHGGEARAEPWVNPETYASGLRVPGPLGDRLVLRTLRESGGAAAAVDDATMRDATATLAAATGIDAAPEGGCALAVLRDLVAQGTIAADAEVVLFNTGSGASYRA